MMLMLNNKTLFVVVLAAVSLSLKEVTASAAAVAHARPDRGERQLKKSKKSKTRRPKNNEGTDDLVSGTPPYEGKVGNKYLNPTCAGTVMFGDLQPRANPNDPNTPLSPCMSSYTGPLGMGEGFWTFDWECAEGPWGSQGPWPTYDCVEICNTCAGGPYATYDGVAQCSSDGQWFCKEYMTPLLSSPNTPSPIDEDPYEGKVGNKYLNPTCAGTDMFGDLQPRANPNDPNTPLSPCMSSHTPSYELGKGYWSFDWTCAEGPWGSFGPWPTYDCEKFCNTCAGGPVGYDDGNAFCSTDGGWFCKAYVAPLLSSPNTPSPIVEDPPRQNAGLLIINNCDEDIDLRTPDMSIKNEPDSNHQTIRKGESVKFEAGTVRGNKVVLAWMEAKDLPCHNGILCTQIELTTSNEYFDTRCHPNFVNQLAYTDMAIGVAFYKQGQPVQECPEATGPGCRDGRQECTSNAGRFDNCMHDVSECTEDVGIKVQLQPNSAHHYCLSPDTNKAVISDQMTNPTKEECAMEMKVGNNDGDWVCGAGSDKCQDHSQDSTGTTGTLCSGVRYDIKKLIQNGLQLWNSATQALLTVEDLENVNIGGAKKYQTAVNKACSNQPPTQRATDGANGPVYKAEDAYGQGTSRSYDQPGRLDHVLTYEGDDVNQWWRVGQKFERRGIFMAGSAGIQCNKQEWDTFVIKACPAGSD